MKGTTKIKSLGMIDLDGVSIGDGHIEVHVPIKDVSKQLDKVFNDCTDNYMRKFKNVKSSDELYFDVRIIFSSGSFRNSVKDESEFTLTIIVWQKSDEKTGKDTPEFYDEIPVSFNERDTRKVKKIIWDGLGAMLLNL